MTDEIATPRPDAQAQIKKLLKKLAKKPKPERGASTIGFPYQDMESALSVAKGMMRGGGVPLTRDQLAGVMNLAANSGNFVLKVATARMFGLLDFNGGKYQLSDLGFAALDTDEKRQRSARAESFLRVPLYRRVYDEFKGKQLPPRPLGLEQAFANFGVAPKQKSVARLVFDKSATQAGFFPNGSDRLIEPIIGALPPTERARAAPEDAPNGTTAERPAPRAEVYQSPDREERHPFIEGLLATLPEPQTLQ